MIQFQADFGAHYVADSLEYEQVGLVAYRIVGRSGMEEKEREFILERARKAAMKRATDLLKNPEVKRRRLTKKVADPLRKRRAPDAVPGEDPDGGDDDEIESSESTSSSSAESDEVDRGSDEDAGHAEAEGEVPSDVSSA